MSDDQSDSELQGLERELRSPEEQDEQLRRQINPQFVKPSGVITTQVFKSGDGKISVYRDSVISPEQALAHWLSLGKESKGCCIVTVREVFGAGAVAKDDSGLPDVHEGHAYIDVQALSRADQQEVANKLKRIATDRGIEWFDS